MRQSKIFARDVLSLRRRRAAWATLASILILAAGCVVFSTPVVEPDKRDARAATAWPRGLQTPRSPPRGLPDSGEPPARSSGRGSSYYASVSLKRQLPTLRRAAEAGDMRSACIVAAAFDLCARNAFGTLMDEYPDAYLASMNERQAEVFSDNVGYRERRVEALCAGMTVDDMKDRRQMLMRSAMAGYASSLSGLLPSQARVGGLAPAESDPAVQGAYRRYAERMLNAAAEAGDMRAIEAISAVYATGELDGLIGVVEIHRDEIKALAAASAILMIQEDRKARKLPHDDRTSEDLRQTVSERMAVMDSEDMARFTELSTKYYAGYKAKSEGVAPGEELLRELPEHACAGNAVVDLH